MKIVIEGLEDSKLSRSSLQIHKIEWTVGQDLVKVTWIEKETLNFGSLYWIISKKEFRFDLNDERLRQFCNEAASVIDSVLMDAASDLFIISGGAWNGQQLDRRTEDSQ